jgi:hypothetical protein
LLRQHLHKLRDSKSHLKVIAAELRTLVCRSSGTEGLLWRLTDELKVGDLVALHLPGKLKQDHPLVRGLEFMIVPIFRAGKGDPRLVPGNHSLRAVIKEGEALVVLGKPLTHEYLIKAVAQQMGTAHEDDGLEPALVQLSTIFVNGVEPYLGILAIDAELTLEVGERVLEVAESRGQLHRLAHSHDCGNVSVVVRVCRKQHLGSRVQLFRFHSYTSEVAIVGLATPTGVLFQLLKRQQLMTEVLAPYPESCVLGEDAIAVLSYCSRTGQLRTITADGPTAPQFYKLGWVHACEFTLEEVSELYKDIIDQRFLLIFERLLSSRDVLELLALPPSGYGLWKHADELHAQGVFPE